MDSNFMFAIGIRDTQGLELKMKTLSLENRGRPRRTFIGSDGKKCFVQRCALV